MDWFYYVGLIMAILVFILGILFCWYFYSASKNRFPSRSESMILLILSIMLTVFAFVYIMLCTWRLLNHKEATQDVQEPLKVIPITKEAPPVIPSTIPSTVPLAVPLGVPLAVPLGIPLTVPAAVPSTSPQNLGSMRMPTTVSDIPISPSTAKILRTMQEFN